MALMTVFRLTAVLLAALLAGCASSVRLPPAGGDGPPLTTGPDPMTLPDAVPRVEPLRVGGPNKPYAVAGVRYVPLTTDAPYSETGLASWYGRQYHGRPTASGEPYDLWAMTAAHPVMPIPSYARVRNPANGREVTVRINDRGPFVPGRVIDLSYAAAVKLGVAGGVTPVQVTRLTQADILARGTAAVAPATLTAAAPTAASAVPLGEPAAVATPVAVAPSAWPTLQPLAAPPEPAPAAQPAPAAPLAEGFWLQFGAFARADGAHALKSDLAARADWLAPLLTQVADGAWHRVQAGPYASRAAALAAAEQARQALALTPIVVERR